MKFFISFSPTTLDLAGELHNARRALFVECWHKIIHFCGVCLRFRKKLSTEKEETYDALRQRSNFEEARRRERGKTKREKIAKKMDETEETHAP